MTPVFLTEHAAGALLGLGHIAIAAWVTIHVLRTRREVGRAMSWIGLAWLSPMLGAVLYLLFGINRVSRRARRLRKAQLGGKAGAACASSSRSRSASPLASLRSAGDRITARGVEGGNAIEMLVAGDGAYPRMLQAIDAARSSIALSTYIFRNDGAGRAFLTALARAHRRGVAVRVLIDGIGGGYFLSSAYRRLRRQGVPVSRFLHTYWPWRMSFLNMRTHRKLLLVDGVVGFMGGLNIGSENLSEAAPKVRVRDVHFRVAGPIAGQLAAVFAEDWEFATGERLAGPAWFPTVAAAGGVEARVISSGPDQDLGCIEAILLVAISLARRSIRIVTPYFLPDEPLSGALATAALRGTDVDIIIPGRGDHRLLDWAMAAHVGPLLHAGCRIWYAPPPFEHAKLMTIDGCWTLLGSANWDMRSLRLNFELNLEAYDAAASTVVEEAMPAMRGRQITAAELEATPFLIGLRNAAARLLLPYL